MKGSGFTNLSKFSEVFLKHEFHSSGLPPSALWESRSGLRRLRANTAIQDEMDLWKTPIKAD